MIKIKITNEINRFLSKCIKNNIALKNIKYFDNFITARINEKELEFIKRINYYSDIEVIKYYGIKSFKIHIKNYILDYLLLIVFLVNIYLLSNIIIEVEIKHENKELKTKISEIIKEYDIRKYVLKKDLNKLNEISDDIIYKNKDIIDWISINNKGMKYEVSVEERINAKIKQEPKSCHIISDKDAIITKLIVNKGDTLVEKSQHVNKGEILISGSIRLNENIKNNICAEGQIYGETWYKIHIIKPLSYIEKEYTKEEKYNISINNKYLLKNKYKNYEEKVIFKIKNFRLIKLKEYKLNYKKYTYEEAKKIALKDATNKLLKKIKEKPTIISQKVLKESKKNSKIELDIFISIEQLISKRITYEVGEENGDITR